MVAAEAAAAGVLPVSAAHSMRSRVSRALAAELAGRGGPGLVRGRRWRGRSDRRPAQPLVRARPGNPVGDTRAALRLKQRSALELGRRGR